MLKKDMKNDFKNTSKFKSLKSKDSGDGDEAKGNMQISNNHLEDTNIDLIRNSLKNHFLFKDLSEDIITRILTNLIIFQINSGLNLFSEGEPGNFFYIVKEGELQLTIPHVDVVKNFKKGDTFGEMALLQKNKRSGSVKALIDSEIFCLEGNIFREIVQKINKMDLKERIFNLNLVPIFKNLSPVELQNVAKGMIKCEFSPSFEVLKEGDSGESLYIIKEGMLSCSKNGKEIKRLNTKEYFGEYSVIFETKRSLTITSLGKSTCYQVSKNVLLDCLGQNFKNILLQGIAKESFSKSKLMKHLLFDDFFQKIFPIFKMTNYKPNQTVIEQDHFKKRKIVIVIEGTLINVFLKF